MERARGAIRALMELAPADALVRRNGRQGRVPVDQIVVGDVVLVGPGEKIPVDGSVIAGTGYVNQAPVTGESLPAEKSIGDEVFAGTINGRGALDIEVTQTPPRLDTRTHHSPGGACTSATRSQPGFRGPVRADLYADRAGRWRYSSRWFPLSRLAAPGTHWFYRALVLLVISCPCALVISTPVSIVLASRPRPAKEF